MDHGDFNSGSRHQTPEHDTPGQSPLCPGHLETLPTDQDSRRNIHGIRTQGRGQLLGVATCALRAPSLSLSHSTGR